MVPWILLTFLIALRYINRKYQSQVWKEVPSDMGQHPIGFHLSGQLSLLHGRVRRRRNHQNWRKRHTSRKNSLPSAAGTLPALPGPLRLVDAEVWCLDCVPVRYARKRDSCIRTYILAKQDGCAQVPSLQLGSGRFLHGDIFR